ncbi:hypothetical protein OBBRIDRAFT_888846 [Obba rivulosa]|uniref:MYND-type domain-containing protein n=1 Tax=Obba rivulosa TaxID=1052685 RepID=A0A8E2AR24_9APHY|nr:hypothetical protein OBBRIDRAFT_888846 [Obba rivulosa]
MAFVRSEIGVHKIPDGVVMYDNMAEYCSLKIATQYNHNEQPALTEILEECSKYLGSNPSETLLVRAQERDILLTQTSASYLSGCGLRRSSAEGALRMWDGITDPQNPELVHGASAETVAKAFSSSAKAYFDKYMTPPDALETLAREERWFERRHGVGGSPACGLPVHGSETPRFRAFKHLWKAVNDRMKEVHAEEQRRQAKIAKAPNAYTCAREGCGIQATNKAAFKSCGGSCPPEIKPHYCSKECQRTDWRQRHKRICRPGSDIPVNALVLHDSSAVLQLGKPGASFDEVDVVNEEEGPGTQINIPGPDGSQYTVKSQNLSPDFMRYLRDNVSNS